jgi:hypothetical protein
MPAATGLASSGSARRHRQAAKKSSANSMVSSPPVDQAANGGKVARKTVTRQAIAGSFQQSGPEHPEKLRVALFGRIRARVVSQAQTAREVAAVAKGDVGVVGQEIQPVHEPEIRRESEAEGERSQPAVESRLTDFVRLPSYRFLWFHGRPAPREARFGGG